jgi:hypothetical protein
MGSKLVRRWFEAREHNQFDVAHLLFNKTSTAHQVKVLCRAERAPSKKVCGRNRSSEAGLA